MPEETMKWEEALPLFVSVKIAAKTLNVGRDHVRKLVKDGTLPFYRFGRAWRIQRQDLLDYIQESKVKKEE